MKEERQQILQMVKDGTITTEQAMELLNALEDDAAPDMDSQFDEPLTGEGHQEIGFYVFTEGQFDNVKVYTKAE